MSPSQNNLKSTIYQPTLANDNPLILSYRLIDAHCVTYLHLIQWCWRFPKKNKNQEKKNELKKNK
jgi:hypothetical protein